MIDDLGNHKLFSGRLNFGMDGLLFLRDMIAVWEVFDNVYFGFLVLLEKNCNNKSLATCRRNLYLNFSKKSCQ